jgi:hypothetical protein
MGLSDVGGIVGASSLTGIVQDEAGTKYGFTDFSEFDLTSSLPTGITEFGDPAHAFSPHSTHIETGIKTVGGEGNYLYSGFSTGGGRIGFGIDSFDSLGLQEGEFLARIWVGTPTSAKFVGGPAYSLVQGASVLSGRGGQLHAKTAATDFESPFSSVSSGSHTTIVDADSDISEAEVESSWIWVRCQMVIEVGNDTFKSKAWYGDIGDEPAGWDTDTTHASALLAAGSMGFMAPAFAAGADEIRCAYFSFTGDPGVVAAPTP